MLKRENPVKRILLSVAALSLASSANAATIIGLFNTGTDATNTALAGGNGVADTHYSILSSTTPGFVGQQAQTYYNPAYIANDANSRWISLSSTGTPGNNTTVYRLTFDLSGFDATTAAISGSWGADNFGSILLNGSATGNALTGIKFENFQGLTNFTIGSGFAAGLNTLDFSVVDGGGPTAFRVDDLVGTVGNAVPEPATWAMMLFGFGVVGSSIRRRRQQAVRVSFI